MFSYEPPKNGKYQPNDEQTNVGVWGVKPGNITFSVTAHRVSEIDEERGVGAYDEPNNTKYIAYPLVIGAIYNADLGQQDEKDWFVIGDAAEGDRINLDISNINSSYGDIKVTLRNESLPDLEEGVIYLGDTDLGALVETTEYDPVNPGESINVTTTIKHNGRLYVEVTSDNPLMPHSYSITTGASGL